MSFETFSEFLQMGGHALYVWLSYGVGVFILIFIYIQPILARKSIIRDLYQRQRRGSQSAKQANNEITQDKQVVMNEPKA
ncbi:MAG: heme exporter protein D [Oleiphilaceae bacterium]